MKISKSWDLFYKTGSVESYLNYCRETRKARTDSGEVYDRRTDNKRK